MSEYLFKDLPDDTVLWRYMSLVKFLDLLSNNALTFCRMDNFEDKYEGNTDQLIAQVLKILKEEGMTNLEDIESTFKVGYEAVKLKSYALCLHSNENESAAMWKLYGHHGETIAIKTTVKKIKDSLSQKEKLFFGSALYGISDAELKEFYCNDRQGNEVISLHGLEPLFLKRPSFEHEKEYRVILTDRDTPFSTVSDQPLNDINTNNSLVSKVACDVEKLIDEIVIYPEASKWVVDAINATIGKFGYSFIAKKSNLYDLK